MTIIEERLADIDRVALKAGGHSSLSQGACAMELVSWIAGEPWSDHPACVSPVLGAFVRRWNDDLDDEGRQKLKPFLPRLIGTAGDGADERRGWMAADWLVRVHTPAWLELAGITDAATALRALPELRDLASLDVARPAVTAARSKAAAARAAAWDAAWAKAGVAAWAKAWDAAGVTAGDAAWDAAGAAAWAAAGVAAGAAAWDAAGVAAWDAAGKELEPTKTSLQFSALALLDRMIEARP